MEQPPAQSPDRPPEKEKPAFYLSIGAMSVIWLLTLLAGSAFSVWSDGHLMNHKNVLDTLVIVLLIAGAMGLMSLVLWAVFILLLEGLNDKERSFGKYTVLLNVYFIIACAVYGFLLVGIMHEIGLVLHFYLPNVFLGLLLINAQVFRLKRRTGRPEQ